MSNDAQELLNEIQYRTGKTLEEIAAEIGYSRPYLNNVKLKGGGEKVVGILREKYKKILQNVPRGTEPQAPGALQSGDFQVTVADYIDEIKRHRDFAESVIKTYLAKIDLNLTTALGGVEQLSLHVESARSVVFDSLDRIEKKPVGSLKASADKIVRRLMKEGGTPGTLAGQDR